MLRDGCAINLDADLLCPRPGCSPAKGHDLGLANVLSDIVWGSSKVAVTEHDTHFMYRITVCHIYSRSQLTA